MKDQHLPLDNKRYALFYQTHSRTSTSPMTYLCGLMRNADIGLLNQCALMTSLYIGVAENTNEHDNMLIWAVNGRRYEFEGTGYDRLIQLPDQAAAIA